jgi:hypothetical protein
MTIGVAMIVKASCKHPLLFSLLVAVVMAVGVLVVAASPAPAQEAGTCRTLTPDLEFCVDVEPEEATNPVGTSHTVTATVTEVVPNGTFPLSGQTVSFEITEGPDAGETGSCIADENGQCTFTFSNNGTPGTDTIVGSVDFGPFTLSDTVTKTFVEAPQQEEAPQQGAPQQVAPAEITQEGEQESVAGEIDQTFEVS